MFVCFAIPLLFLIDDVVFYFYDLASMTVWTRLDIKMYFSEEVNYEF